MKIIVELEVDHRDAPFGGRPLEEMGVTPEMLFGPIRERLEWQTVYLPDAPEARYSATIFKVRFPGEEG